MTAKERRPPRPRHALAALVIVTLLAGHAAVLHQVSSHLALPAAVILGLLAVFTIAHRHLMMR